MAYLGHSQAAWKEKGGGSLSRVSLVTPRFVPEDALAPSMAYFGLCKAAWKVPNEKELDGLACLRASLATLGLPIQMT